MNRDIGRLEIEKLIVHDIPSRKANSEVESPILSEIESPLNPSVTNYIRDKIVGTLVNNSLIVNFDPSIGSRVPELVFDNLGDQAIGFVETSQKLATFLFETQTGVNTDGLLVVAQTELEGVPSVALVKLEREAGTRVLEIEIQGKHTLDVQYLQDLMLTDKTRVFKVGLFVQEGDSIETIQGWVSDNQSSRMHRGNVADFFLRKFLGCRPREAPDITTKNHYDATELWLNQEVTDSSKKARYAVFVAAEMQRPTGVVRPRWFAGQYLDTEDRRSYIEHLENHDLPTTEFIKDTSLIESRLRKISMDLESGLTILGRAEVIDERVEMTPLQSGLTRIEIVDRVKGIKGRG